jgi:hypothetical protein
MKLVQRSNTIKIPEVQSNELSTKKKGFRKRTLKGARQKVPSPEDNQAKQNGPYETRKEDTCCRDVWRVKQRNGVQKARCSQKATSRALINTRGGSIALLNCRLLES